MDTKTSIIAFIVIGILGIAVGIPVAVVVGLFIVKIVIPVLVLLALGGLAVGVIIWLSSDDHLTD